MSRRTVVELLDDLDGTKIEAGGTIRFALRGAEYEIDLSEESAKALDSALEPFIAAARRVSASAPKSAPRTRRRKSTQQLADIREWARANGHAVSDRGRVPAAVREAYELQH